MPKRKILIHSNSSRAFTGFGKNCKNILRYLAATDKYELFEFANGLVNGPIEEGPWKIIGSMPNDRNILSRLNDPAVGRAAGYGLLTIDKVIEEVKPDIYIGIEDIWAFPEIINKPWWNKINCMIWTTLDSLPLLPEAVSLAPKIKHYYCWSDFAEKAAKNLGVNNLQTLHGSIDEKNFFRLEDKERQLLRKRFDIPEDSFVIGFVFRNQLRKTVGDLIAGYRVFLNKYPESDAKLLLHTNWAEGWDIPRFINENGLDPKNILTTYVCSKCHGYSIKPFSGHSNNCPHCGCEKTYSTVSVVNGVSEPQLNEIYNLMDLYVHPFTSGGQEIPLQEAKLTELITAATDYSCGREMVCPESGGIPLPWAPYREIGTQFVKASTSVADIAKVLHSVWSTPEPIRREQGSKARKYVIKNYSFQSVGKRLEEIIDAMPISNYDFSTLGKNPNPSWNPSGKYASVVDFVKDLYLNFLNVQVDETSEGFLHWKQRLERGEDPKSIVAYFRDVAQKEISKNKPLSAKDFIEPSTKKKLALVVHNDSFIALICSFLIPEICKRYQFYDLYVFCEPKLHSLFEPYVGAEIFKLCPKTHDCENLSAMEGRGNEEGIFDICLLLNKDELNAATFSHNGNT